MANSPLQYPRHALAASLPGLDAQISGWLGELIDVVFFSSLEKEEGTRTLAKVVFHPQGVRGLLAVKETEEFGNTRWETPAWQVLPLIGKTQVVSLSVESLVKAAPMALLSRTALVVAPADGGLVIEGIARRMERSYYAASGEEGVIVCTSQRPGQVILSAKGYPVFWYEEGATLNIEHGAELRDLLSNPESIIRATLRAMCLDTVTKGTARHFHVDRYSLVAEAVAEIVETMVEAARGGLIAIVSSDDLTKFEVGKYRVSETGRRTLTDSLVRLADNEAHQRSYWFTVSADDEEAQQRAIAEVQTQRSRLEFAELAQLVGQLASVDNAVLLGPELSVLCAGYHVEPVSPLPRVQEVSSVDGKLVVGEFAVDVHGARHVAAASFAARFPGSVAFVLSEDGALRCLHRPVVVGADVLLWTLRAPVEL